MGNSLKKVFQSSIYLDIGYQKMIKRTGRRSELQKSERRNAKRTSKIYQSIRTTKVSIEVIRTSKIKKIRTTTMYYLRIPRPVGVR
jgi:hypothetical protein